ncbi:MAG TPA: hypothetical protein VNM40_02905 [Candidatus Paceibacterota bacterium]|nr:hypothetical protein [Candidatus Paceibacterota bacterium]
MELSLFLAKVIGVVLIAFSAAGLARPQIIHGALRDFNHESFSRLVVGCLAIALGAALVLSHNIWEVSWRGLVTLFGWLTLVKGGLYLLAPKALHQLSTSMLRNESQTRVFLFVCLVVGLYLAYHGFGI